jgi:hypothetical protein
MPAIQDISQISAIWGSQAEMARDLGLPYQQVAKWFQRGRIPPESFELVIEKARLKDVALSHAVLNGLNAPRGTTVPVRAN